MKHHLFFKKCNYKKKIEPIDDNNIDPEDRCVCTMYKASNYHFSGFTLVGDFGKRKEREGIPNITSCCAYITE